MRAPLEGCLGRELRVAAGQRVPDLAFERVFTLVGREHDAAILILGGDIEEGLAQAALSLGLTRAQSLRLVQLPLALPTLMAGVKTAAVINVGTATMAAFIGAGGFGERIVAGLAVNDSGAMLAGALPAAVLALRANGVPARLVTGYRVSESLDGGLWLVRERDAHAWAEWQDAAGRWQTLDATPLDYGAAVADYGGGALERAWQRLAARLDAWWQGVELSDGQVQAVLLAGLAVLAGLFVREYRRLRRVAAQAANSREWLRLWRRFLRASGLPERPQWTASDYLARLPEGWSASRRAAARRFLEQYAAARFAPDAAPTAAAAALRDLRRGRLSG